ncbi:MAG: FHA domain-containing protein [Methylococcales bacterium]
MAKLTLSFKSKPIQVYFFEIGQSISVGRDEANDIFVDSLAIAPQHAKFSFGETNTTIEIVDENAPIQVNGDKITTAQLKHGDKIGIGKHTLEYAEEKPVIENAFSSDDNDYDSNKARQKPKEARKKPGIGKLQVLRGKKAGQIIPLSESQALVGNETTSQVEFIRCSDGYYLSATKEHEAGAIQLNNQSINRQTLKVADGDYVKIDGTEFLFFME